MNKISNTLIIPKDAVEHFVSFGNFGEAEHYRHVAICGGIGKMPSKGYQVVFNKHSANEIFFIVSGSMYVEYNNKTIIARAGDVFFLPNSLSPHIYGDIGDEPLSMFWLHLRSNLAGFPEHIVIPKAPFCRSSQYIKELELLINLLYLQERSADISGIDSIFMLVKYLKKELENIPEEANPTIEQVKKTFSHVKNNLKKRWSIKELAKISCLSESHFFAITKKTYGETPYEIIRRLKMENAVSLLQRCDLKIEYIARESGYANAFSFSKAFYKIYKCAPGIYRKKQQK